MPENYTDPLEVDFYGNTERLVAVFEGRYADGTPAIDLIDADDHHLWGTLTVCLPNSGVTLESNEIIVKLWSENEPYYQLLDTPHFADTQKRLQAGFAVAHIWTTTLPINKEL